MKSIRQVIWNFFTLIIKGHFAFTLPVAYGVPTGVSKFDGEEDDEEETEKSGICANCGKYDCEC